MQANSHRKKEKVEESKTNYNSSVNNWGLKIENAESPKEEIFRENEKKKLPRLVLKRLQ